jgi:hypothetical protein
MYLEIGPRMSISNVSEPSSSCAFTGLCVPRRRAGTAIADAAEGVLRQKSLRFLRNSLAHKTNLER